MAHYIEIVSSDSDALVGTYQQTHGVTFGEPDADLGHARVAMLADGTLLAVRKPLAEHEQPIVRLHAAVDDISGAVKRAQEQGAVVAYGPTKQGERGTFAIVFQGGVQLGYWRR